MGRGMQAYLIVRSSLQKRNLGRKNAVDRVSKLFGLLTEDQATRLEQSELPDEQGLQALADRLSEPLETVHQELSNFVYWLEHSPQIR